jgi:hypothetical protein
MFAGADRRSKSAHKLRIRGSEVRILSGELRQVSYLRAEATRRDTLGCAVLTEGCVNAFRVADIRVLHSRGRRSSSPDRQPFRLAPGISDYTFL